MLTITMDCHGAMGTNVEASVQKAYTIGGVPIIFPYKAYPSQITMMDRIIKCLNKKNNCLLESPTGSGKSLALLCASLAWLKKASKEFREQEEILYRNLNAYGVALADDNQSYYGEQSKIISEEYKFNKYSKDKISDSKTNMLQKSDNTKSIKSKSISSEFHLPKDCSDVSKANDKNTSLLSDKSENVNYEKDPSKKRGIIYIDEDDMEDFQPIKKIKRSSNAQDSETSFSSQNNSLTEAASPEQCKKCVASELETKVNDTECETIQSPKIKAENQINSTLPLKIPKIYFGTRTHKQIGQIIRELKKTPYKNVKMTILSSRERTCIHPKVSKSHSKNDDCNDLNNREEGPGCGFYINTLRGSSIHHIVPQSAYDLEDFVSICKRKKLCPYYGSRELLTTAEIVFCPYNYLIDPLVRSAMNIDLKGNIVIMDEAHNIEDCGRNAASTCISVSQLQDAIADILNAGQLKHEGSEPYMHIAKVLENLKRWLENSQDLKDYVSFDSSSKVWSGDDMIAFLDYVGLGPDTFPKFQSMYTIINREEKETEKEKEKKPELIKLLGQTHFCLENLTLPLSYIYKEKLLFAPDYRCVVMKSKSYSGDTSLVTFSQKSKRKSLSNTFNITLNFWCLNPAVAFSDLKDIHSLVVASGTLAPLTSFQSELGIPFHLTLEANHVINSKNIWIGSIGKGPSNNSLNATFHNAATFTFQDDVGNLVLEVCSLIPHGVLCFLPSYGMLDKLVNRWQITGLWDKLLSKKVVLTEPRANENFQQVISEFYDAVRDSETNDCLEVKGALFLAVCRGKVSEGLDFADNNARAVITIGIPFPNVKDAQVDLKKKYNDFHSSKRQLVPGGAWYEMQAFRALNQALGRCIRHRNDFGALIIVDERFQKYDRYVSSLSKWIKKEIKHYPTFYDALCSLSNFATAMGLKNTTE